MYWTSAVGCKGVPLFGGQLLAHAPAEDVHHVDAVVAQLAVAEIPEPVPVVVDQVLVIRLHGRGSNPEVPIQPCRRLLRLLETDRVPAAGKEEVGLIHIGDLAVVNQLDRVRQHQMSGLSGLSR